MSFLNGSIERVVVDRFWQKVEIRSPDECWPWLGAKASNGYGRAYFGRRAVPATQLAWSIANGEQFPPGLLACHKCDNPICVNPDHIWPGTQSENIKDCVAKGRNTPRKARYCKRGHGISAQNRISIPDGGRCRECQLEHQRKYMRRRRAANREKLHG